MIFFLIKQGRNYNVIFRGGHIPTVLRCAQNVSPYILMEKVCKDCRTTTGNHVTSSKIILSKRNHKHNLQTNGIIIRLLPALVLPCFAVLHVVCPGVVVVRQKLLLDCYREAKSLPFCWTTMRPYFRMNLYRWDWQETNDAIIPLNYSFA